MSRKEEIKKISEEQKKILEEIMDNKDNFYFELSKFENQFQFIPEKYKSDIRLMNAYAEYKRYKGWRNIPGVMATINKAAKKAAENIMQGQKPMTIKEKEKYLKEKTDYIYNNVPTVKKKLKDFNKKDKGLSKDEQQKIIDKFKKKIRKGKIK